MTATPTLMQVNVGALYSAPAEAYYASADRRITAGMRYALELLGIPFPLYAMRSAGGPNPRRDVARAYASDNPAEAKAARRLSKARRSFGTHLDGRTRDQLDSLRSKAARQALASARQ